MTPSHSQISPRTIWTVAGHVLFILGLLLVLKTASTVVSWVLIALFLALALDPAVDALHRRGLPRGIAVLLALAVAVGLVVVLVTTLVPMLADQVRSLVAAGPEILARFEQSRLGGWLERFDLIDRARTEATERGPASVGPMLGVVAGVAEGALGAITVTVLTIFMLLFGEDVFASATAWIEPGLRQEVIGTVLRMKKSVGGYVAGSLLIAGIGGAVTTIGMLVLGVPYFLPLGLLMFIMGVIPFLGGAIGAIAVVGSTFATAGTKAGVIALVGWLVYQQVENHLLQPLIQRKTIKMNPLLITLVMLFGTALFGLLGALLALPVAGALQVLLKERLARRAAAWDPPPVTAPAASPALTTDPAAGAAGGS